MGPDVLSGCTLAERILAALMQPGDVPLFDEMFPRPAWMADSACREHPEVNFHSARGGGGYDAAKAVCGGCLVELECLEYALDDSELQGCWGGTTPPERDALRAARGDARQRKAGGLYGSRRPRAECGTHERFKQGCRCEPCWDALRDYVGLGQQSA